MIYDPIQEKKELNGLICKILNKKCNFDKDNVEPLRNSVKIFHYEVDTIDGKGYVIGEYSGIAGECFEHALKEYLTNFCLVNYFCGCSTRIYGGKVLYDRSFECRDRLKELQKREQELEKRELEVKKRERIIEVFY